jgi:hypothetical protein
MGLLSAPVSMAIENRVESSPRPVAESPADLGPLESKPPSNSRPQCKVTSGMWQAAHQTDWPSAVSGPCLELPREGRPPLTQTDRLEPTTACRMGRAVLFDALA